MSIRQWRTSRHASRSLSDFLARTMWRKFLSLALCRNRNFDPMAVKAHIKYKMLHKMKCTCAQASLHHDTPEIFTRCYWQCSERVAIPWMLYKVLLAIYMTVTWYLSYINYGRVVVKDKYFIYFTNWSYLLLTIQCLISAFIVCHRFCMERRNRIEVQPMAKLPFMYKVHWALHSISLPSAVVVTAVFWAVVYNPALHPIDLVNVTVHVFNTLIPTIDFLLVGHPYRLLHFYWTFFYALSYLVFTVIYYLAGGTDIYDRPFIYKILDWRSPLPASITVLGVLVFMCIIHVLFWAIQLFKDWVKRRCWAATAGRYAEGQENLGMDHKPISTINVV